MITPLSDRIAVILSKPPGRIGNLWIPNLTAQNQTFVEARVAGHGIGVKSALTRSIVVVSELFGDAVEVVGIKLKIGRERDIVGVLDGKNIKPVGDRVLAIAEDYADKAGGIFLPETQKGSNITAKVVAVGPDSVLEAGMRVLVPKKRFLPVFWEGVNYLLIDEPAALAVLEDKTHDEITKACLPRY